MIVTVGSHRTDSSPGRRLQTGGFLPKSTGIIATAHASIIKIVEIYASIYVGQCVTNVKSLNHR